MGPELSRVSFSAAGNNYKPNIVVRDGPKVIDFIIVVIGGTRGLLVVMRLVLQA